MFHYLFLITKKTGEFNGYNLMNGKLYLKIEDDTKPVMFLDVKLSKLNDVLYK